MPASNYPIADYAHHRRANWTNKSYDDLMRTFEAAPRELSYEPSIAEETPEHGARRWRANILCHFL
jgi:hypothetical protein